MGNCKYVYSHDIYHNCDAVSIYLNIGFNTKKECWEHEIHRLGREVEKLNNKIARDTAYRDMFLDNIEEIKNLLKSESSC